MDAAEQSSSPDVTHSSQTVRLPAEAWTQLERIGAVMGCDGAELAADLLEAICCTVGTQAVLDRDGVRIMVPAFILGIPTIMHQGDETKRLRRRADALEGEVVAPREDQPHEP